MVKAKTQIILELYKEFVDNQADKDIWPPTTPTTQWLAMEIDTSTSVVNYHLLKLVKDGLLKQSEPNTSYRLTAKAIRKLWPTTQDQDLRFLHPKFLATQEQLTGTSSTEPNESASMSSSTPPTSKSGESSA